MITGSCRFGLWRVEVAYAGSFVYRVRFLRRAQEGPVPAAFTAYLVGKSTDFAPLKSVAVADTEGPYADIYRAVMQIPYGETRTYGEIAELSGTHPCVVGNAMARNPTPLIVPCHRVVAATGIGNFTPDPDIKRDLLALESKAAKKLQK